MVHIDDLLWTEANIDHIARHGIEPADVEGKASHMARSSQVQSRIPTFASYEEEAAFWDAYDPTEDNDEFEPVEVEFARPLGHLVALRLDAATIRRLQAAAEHEGVSLSTFAQTWIQIGLEQAEARAGRQR